MVVNGLNELAMHEKAMQICEKRTNLLAANLANLDTPGFKAKDLDFKDIMQKMSKSTQGSLQTTHQAHIAPSFINDETQLRYRNPISPSLDGNTVDGQLEVSEFTNNAMHYSASMQFFNSSIKTLISAIRGD